MKKLLLLILLFPLTVSGLPSNEQTPVTRLVWSVVTTNTDGSSVTPSGYKVYYSTSGIYDDINSVFVTDTQKLLADLRLADGKYSVVVTAVNSNNLESAFTNEVTFEIQGGQPHVKQAVPAAPILLIK